jgi:hypothetical protein
MLAKVRSRQPGSCRSRAASRGDALYWLT